MSVKAWLRSMNRPPPSDFTFSRPPSELRASLLATTTCPELASTPSSPTSEVNDRLLITESPPSVLSIDAPSRLMSASLSSRAKSPTWRSAPNPDREVMVLSFSTFISCETTSNPLRPDRS